MKHSLDTGGRALVCAVLAACAVLGAAGHARGEVPAPAVAPAPAPAVAPVPVLAPIELDDRPLAGTLITVEGADGAERRRRRALEQPAFVTVVAGGATAPGEPPPVAEVLARVAGASVRSLGGLGSFASISIRGAPAGQTELLLDGVPLSRLGTAALDVGQLDLATFDEVEIWRGSVPVELGGATLGGAVNFITGLGPGPDGTRTWMSLGLGSFGARRARIVRRDRATLAGVPISTSAAVSYAAATGDFTFHHDGGTPVEPVDDGLVTRANNDYRQLDAVVRARLGTRASGVELGERISVKTQGVPGAAAAAAVHTALDTRRSITDVRARIRRGVASIEGTGYLLVEEQTWRDPMGEVGLSAQERAFATRAGGLGVRGRWRPLEELAMSAATDGRVERFRERDVRSGASGASGGREGVAVAIATELTAGPLIAVPGLRLDLLETHGTPGPDDAMPTAPEPRSDVAWSPRLGLRWRIAPALALKASVGRAFRVPTIIELFGDRGVVVGSPELRPETGTTQDVGFVIAPEATRHLDRVLIEWAVFRADMNDLIALQATSAGTLRALNLGGAHLRGHELAATARVVRRVTVAAAYSFLDTAQDTPLISADGHPLPGRPRHEAFARAEVAILTGGLRPLVEGGSTSLPRGHRGGARSGGPSLAAWLDVTLASGNALDVAGRSEVPARRLFGAGVRYAPRPGVALSLEGRNLLDARKDDVALSSSPRPGVDSVPRALSDVLGYPLPGRAVTVTLDLTH